MDSIGALPLRIFPHAASISLTETPGRDSTRIPLRCRAHRDEHKETSARRKNVVAQTVLVVSCRGDRQGAGYVASLERPILNRAMSATQQTLAVGICCVDRQQKTFSSTTELHNLTGFELLIFSRLPAAA